MHLRYEAVPSNDAKHTFQLGQSQYATQQALLCCGKLRSRGVPTVLLASMFSALLSGMLCYFLGQSVAGYPTSGHHSSNYLSATGDTIVVFEYDVEFAMRSEEGVEDPWVSLFPKGGGFVQHPEVSPEPSCLSVYHQLHCLDTIRKGYWAAKDGKTPEHHATSAHVRHCIDYLRQSLICHADTNFEPIVQDGGVSGFGTEKKCRDFSQVGAWANTWAWENQTILSESAKSP